MLLSIVIWINCIANVSIETNQPQNKVSNYTIYSIGSQIYAVNGITGKITHNNTSATRTVQDSLNDLPVGDKIFLRIGTYIITSTILIPSNVIIAGESWNTVKLANLVNVNIFDAKSSGVTNITIRSLQIDGNKAEQTLLYPQDIIQ